MVGFLWTMTADRQTDHFTVCACVLVIKAYGSAANDLVLEIYYTLQ